MQKYKPHYANDTLLHIIATHSLAHSTLPALQKTDTHSASASTTFSPRIHSVKVDKFCLLGNKSRIIEWESILLPVFYSSGLSS